MDTRYILQNEPIYMFLIIGKMSLRPVEIASRAGWNGFAGRIWPAGRSLETPALNTPLYVSQTIILWGYETNWTRSASSDMRTFSPDVRM